MARPEAEPASPTVTARAHRRRGRPGAPTVLVLGTDFRAGPWACRSLAAAGYRVVGAHGAGFLAGGRSLACPNPRRYPWPTADPAGFVDAVRELCRRHGVDVVLPATEDTTRFMAEKEPDLGRVVTVGPSRAVYDALCDKGRLAATARRVGVDHPQTVGVAADGPADPLPALPSIVKPRISGEDLREAPAVIFVATAAERDRAIATYLDRGLEAIVQERLVGPRWVAQSVRSEDGRLDLVASRIERDYPRSAGVASVMSFVREPPHELRDSVGRLLGMAGFVGPSTISFIHQDGRWVVHDVNLRLGSSTGGVMRAGLDMPRRAVEAALGIDGPPPVPRAFRYVRLDGELAALRDALRGRAADESPLRLARTVARAALGRGQLLDPQPYEPFLLARVGGLALCRAGRRARRRGAVAEM